jgi:hypothetical protein
MKDLKSIASGHSPFARFAVESIGCCSFFYFFVLADAIRVTFLYIVWRSFFFKKNKDMMSHLET